MLKLSKDDLKVELSRLGIVSGDTILMKANLGKIGLIDNGRNASKVFIESILEILGPGGTLIAPAYTHGSFLRKPREQDFFHLKKMSYAGALPNGMMKFGNAFRSSHPTCSYIGIGKNAKLILSDHNESSFAYGPVSDLINLNAKCVLLGCTKESIGFHTVHYAETVLGFHRRIILPQLFSLAYFKGTNGELELFRRKDPGMCSANYGDLFGQYLRNELLDTGWVGGAYCVIGNAKDCYKVDLEILSKNYKFNLCDNPDCFQCRLQRWDTLHKAPYYFFRKIIKKIVKRSKIAAE